PREEDGRPKLLDLKVALDVGLEAEADAARRDQEERQKEDPACDEEGEHRLTRPADAAPRERQRDEAVDLDRRVGAEDRARGGVTGAEDREERERGQERGERVVA